jgi:hypothetical protein
MTTTSVKLKVSNKMKLGSNIELKGLLKLQATSTTTNSDAILEDADTDADADANATFDDNTEKPTEDTKAEVESLIAKNMDDNLN